MNRRNFIAALMALLPVAAIAQTEAEDDFTPLEPETPTSADAVAMLRRNALSECGDSYVNWWTLTGGGWDVTPAAEMIGNVPKVSNRARG